MSSIAELYAAHLAAGDGEIVDFRKLYAEIMRIEKEKEHLDDAEDLANELSSRNMQNYLRKRYADWQSPSPRDIQARRLRAENLRRSDAAPAANRLSASYVSL
jgi:hypothetical protein